MYMVLTISECGIENVEYVEQAEKGRVVFTFRRPYALTTICSSVRAWRAVMR